MSKARRPWSHGWFMVKSRTDVLEQSLETLPRETEALRPDLASHALQSQILASQVDKSLLGSEDFALQVIYSNGFQHAHPADLLRQQNGDLLLLTCKATEHYAPDGGVVMASSKDGGRTWGERQVIAHDDKLDLRERCGVQLRDGKYCIRGTFWKPATSSPSSR